MRIETQEAWQAARLAVFPGEWAPKVAELHAGKAAESLRAGNLWLADLAEKVGALKVPIDLSDSELRDMARDCAKRAMSLTEGAGGLVTLPEYREKLERFVSGYGIKAPERERITRTGKKAGTADAPAVRRMTDELWWRRALRRAQGRALEGAAIDLGYVHRKGEIYASNVTVERRGQQKRRNAATLEETSAVNLDTGEVFTLGELAAKANSNPVIRRGELMVRIRGFEEVARGLDHAAEFWTATCPSRMHPKKIGAHGVVMDNHKFDGTSPRDAQRYLSKTWGNFRAAAWRRGLRFYGFRIAEPHHDATPHWHLLLFMPKMLDAGRSAVGRLRALFRRYFLRDSAKEYGAKRNRVEFVGIDFERGSAAGYIAKYVSKNIDGFQVQGDFEGECDAVTGSQRVEAWASTWSIRQFQQVGGPPVGVWRELRRMRDADESYGPDLEAARAAADAANWRRYVEVQGGPVVARADLPLRVAYTRAGARWSEKDGGEVPAPMNRYGEEAQPAIYGVKEVFQRRAHVSRLHRWEVRRFGVSRPSAARAARTCVNNCSRGEINDGRQGGFIGAGTCRSGGASMERGAGIGACDGGGSGRADSGGAAGAG